LATDRQHHKSKRKRYTVVLVPDEDSSKAKNFQLTLSQLVSGIIALTVIAVALVLIVLTYTPAGRLFPLSNRGLENKYNRELISLNQRMTDLMEQLVNLRAYNLKLRKAMGENVALSDSALIKSATRIAEAERENIAGIEGVATKTTKQSDQDQQILQVRPVRNGSFNPLAVSFPAILPAEGYLTRGFDPEHNHYGLDIAGKTGTLINAAADGNIVFSGWTYNDGYVVIISHAGGFMSFYKHNQSLLKSVGAFVRRGEPIATLGNSGITSHGPHVHFEIWKDGVPVDPSAYMINIYL
jgi:murein DD-endopeptidase MepM/ murein hydrolase activator NlpD